LWRGENVKLKCTFDDLNLKVGDELTLIELDDRVERFIDNDRIDTPLMFLGVDEIICEEKYIYFTEEFSDVSNTIYFEIADYTHDENTKIRIIGFD
jgi:hypothetical protein